MVEYIEREALLADFGEEPLVWYDEDHEIQARNDWHMYKNMVEAQPAADVVEVDALKAWLYEMAMNNTDNYLCTACEEIISRLDGLRVFAKERKCSDAG